MFNDAVFEVSCACIGAVKSDILSSGSEKISQLPFKNEKFDLIFPFGHKAAEYESILLYL